MANPAGPSPAEADRAVQPQNLQPRRAHVLHYRFSTSLFGRRFYMAFLAGTENRSMRRVREDGSGRNVVVVATELAVICLALSMMICLLTGLVVIALYFGKIAMGIDLMDGPSVLHPIYDFFFGS